MGTINYVYRIHILSLWYSSWMVKPVKLMDYKDRTGKSG